MSTCFSRWSPAWVSGVGFIALLFCLNPWPVFAADNEEVVEAEKVLTHAHLKTDPASLQAFFREQTLPDKRRSELAGMVRLLGDNSYKVRERAGEDLIRAGHFARAFLRQALNDRDLEIARRAERCLQSLEAGPSPEIPTAAARLLAARRPAGAAQVLLAYLPDAGEEGVEEAILLALAELTSGKGKADPIVLSAQSDREPLRRAAAAFVLGRSADADQRALAAKLLTDDAVRVRFEAARALLLAGDKAGMPTVITLLTEAPLDLTWQVEEMLCKLAGDDLPGVTLGTGSETSRRQCRAAWQAWWQRNRSRIDLARIKQDQHLLGLTLIADLDGGSVTEFGADHHERWRANGLRGPVDVHYLSNGHLLVAENHASQVTERDTTGKIIWKKDTSGLPASCQRLPNGNTFIATTNLFLEFAPDGREVLRIHPEEGAYGVQKLRNGNIVLATSSGKIVTVDSRGKLVRGFETGGIVQWSMLDVLPNGHVLACCLNGKVTEFDATGKPVWSCSVANPVCARRLPNGHTLVCDSEGRRAVEVDRTGYTVWEHKTKGRPWCVSRR